MDRDPIQPEAALLPPDAQSAPCVLQRLWEEFDLLFLHDPDWSWHAP